MSPVRPAPPEHHITLRWTNGSELANCNRPTRYDSRGHRTWCGTRRDIVRYAVAGHPVPTLELPVRTRGWRC